MEAKDLKTGNLIYRVGHVHEVDWATIKLCTQRNKQFNEDFKPIELNEEWLIKFPLIPWLEKDDNGYYVKVIDKIIRVKFVHSLQNIYFCVYEKDAVLK